MSKSIAAISITAGAAIALVAGLAVFLTSVAPGARAAPHVTGSLEQPHAKGDRLLTRVTGAACSTRSWPSYDQNCLFDLRRPANEARTVRVIAQR